MGEPMRGEDVPQEWITAAMGGYSMHGSGLIANIVAAVAPRIAAAERDRLREVAEKRKGELVLHGLLVDALPWSMLIGLLDGKLPRPTCSCCDKPGSFTGEDRSCGSCGHRDSEHLWTRGNR